MSDSWEVPADGSMITDTDMDTWLGDDPLGDDPDVTGEAEFASWLRSLPADIRAEYLTRPWAGPLESEAAGFGHHDADPGSGMGFSAGGAHDMLPPGPDLAALAVATDIGRAELGESALIGVLCAWQRLTSWAQAGQAATLMTLVRRRQAQARELDRPALADHVSDEVAAAMRLTGRSANQLLFTAGGLDRLPGVWASLQRGEIDWAKACLFVDQLASVSDEDSQEIAATLLGRAGGMTSGQLRAALMQAVLAHDPEAAERRRKAARADSGVHAWTETSGNAALAGRELATSDVIHASARLTAFARWLRKNGATEPMDQLRAAVYVALLTGRPVESLLPTGPESSPGAPATATPADTTPAGAASGSWPQLAGTVNLTMPMSTWLCLTRRPGEVASYGPVDAETCRNLSAAMDPATRYCLTVTDEQGNALAHACATHGPAPPRSTRGPHGTLPGDCGPPSARPPSTRPPRGQPPSAGPPGPEAHLGEPSQLAWAAGLADRLQYFETAPCSHARQSVSYQPPPSLRHLIEIRQRHCAAPGCRRATVRCDLDHTIPFDKGGRTCECDLAPLCRRHHRAKQAPRWHLSQNEPGRMTWRLPHDRTYHTVGETYPV